VASYLLLQGHISHQASFLAFPKQKLNDKHRRIHLLTMPRPQSQYSSLMSSLAHSLNDLNWQRHLHLSCLLLAAKLDL